MRKWAIAAATAWMLIPCGGALAACPGDNQNEMNMCAQTEFEAADAQLNVVYRRVMASSDAPGKATLVQTERAWIAYRDKQCKAESAGDEGGSIYPMVHAGCLTRLTKTRIRELRDQLNGE